MSKIFYHPDINYQDIKKIESAYNSDIEDSLVEKASEFITKEIINYVDTKSKILIVCGPGFNGLDGLLVARNLYNNDYNLKVLMTRNAHQDYISKYNLFDIIIDEKINFNNFDFIVDCIFGYGLNRELNSTDINLVNAINQSKSLVISVDIPTGLDSSTGTLLPISINCDFLITLLTYKKGLFTNQGRDTWKTISYGKLINDDLTSDHFLLTANKNYNGTSQNNIKTKDYEQKNKYSCHKKSNGISCIVAGESPYHGALIMSCNAAMQTGCQYLHVITEPEYAHSLPLIIPEIISSSFSHSMFAKSIKNFSNILVGPGILLKGKEFVKIALDNLDSLNSLIVDAGGLIHLDKNKKYSKKLIITPHPGEAAELLNISSADVQADRYKSVADLQRLFNCIVILKGSGTIIYDGKNFYTCMDGNYRMAVAGMGDILSGILLSELSSSRDNIEACIKSVVYHSYSSDYLLTNSKNKNYLPSMIPKIYSELTNL